MIRNHWQIFDDETAEWRAEFPALIQNFRADLFLEFIDRLLEQAAIFEVYRMLKSESDGYDSLSGQTYVQHLEHLLTQKGEIDAFKDTWLVTFGKIRTPSRIAYLDKDGWVVESDIEDVTGLLIDLHPEYIEEAGYAQGNQLLKHRFAPVNLHSWRIPAGKKETLRHSPTISIQLNTDIWFPYVMGWDEEAMEGTHIYDNRALAGKHTGRLNAFLENARDLTLSMNGEWQRIHDVSTDYPLYAPALTETGIRLDYEPDKSRRIYEPDE